MPDNIGQMFYYGEIPWHKKGTRLTHPATGEEAIKEGGLNWRVNLVPIQTCEHPPRSTRRRLAVVRDDLEPGDRNAVLGVVHPDFRPLQNREAMEVFDALLGPAHRGYHTGGYLGHGEVIWLMARLPEDIKIAGEDVVEPYMLLTNSHDGTIAIDFRLTTVRVVCQNTLALARRGKKLSSHVFKRAHNVSPKTLQIDAEEFYQICTKATAEVGAEFRVMHEIRFDRKQFDALVADLVPLPHSPAGLPLDGTARKRYEARVEEITETRKSIATVFANGLSNGLKVQPAEETLWGALNAITAFVDHKQDVNGDRYAYILFGRGATLKQKAYDLVLAQVPK